jgi:heat shock protein HslJ
MNRQPDRNRLRALDGVEPPEQWDDIVLRADSDLPRLQLRPAHTSHRLLVAAVVLVLAGVAGALVMSTTTGDRGELEAVAADDGSTPAFPAGGGDAPGTDATTPDGLPVPTTQASGSGGDGDGSGSGSGSGTDGSSGSGDNGNGSSGSGPNGMRTTTTVASGGTTTTVVAPTTTAPSTATTVTAPTETDAGGEVPADPPPSPVWGKRWQVLLMAQAGVSRPMGTDRLMSVDARTEGELALVVCNRIGATASIDGDRLVVSLGASPGQSCGEPLDGHEAFLTAFFDNDPTFVVDGNRLVLTVGNRRVELTPY